ncbi:predicted protein [Pyrenophora tritici-repentis Pt-1C-BFP]|uniref:Uncharacterized protein n=1 Tax=Pyrenophora tritici-repentis (strain Pt-1C-BFP) TaxID=426418 RepID=B2WKL4_PYRTR|nr:uncharacterized protein PTRG_10524 [Pyrenophora tritici-repentis Pt-1C-BFP]EDU43574.1 predicted protein [Pyrenophora tritici-repentis Pt-1C-BFP]
MKVIAIIAALVSVGSAIAIPYEQRCQQASQAGLILIDCRSQTILCKGLGSLSHFSCGG